MNGTKAVVKPAGLGAIDEIGYDVERVRVVEFRVDDVRDRFIVEIDLCSPSLAPQIHTRKHAY